MATLPGPLEMGTGGLNEADDAPNQEALKRARRALFAMCQLDLVRERHTRLEQAGSRSGQKISLADVFVDLHASPPRGRRGGVRVGKPRPITREERLSWRFGRTPVLEFDDDEQENDSGKLPPAFLAGVCGGIENAIGVGPNESERAPIKLLLTAGPGGGKSTFGQMWCQVHRANLISKHGGSLSALVGNVAKATLESAAAWQITEIAPRWPIRILLGDLASWLFENQPTEAQVLGYLAALLIQKLPKASEGANSLLSDLDVFFSFNESLFVFDGLDEVAETAGRAEVVDAIQAFCEWLTKARSKTVVLVTSRPTTGETPIKGFVERRIQPLSRARAAALAERLIVVRHPTDTDRANAVVERLAEAFSGDITKSLFQVPLHVAMMVVLVDAIGRLPEERWRLFDEHYRVLYQRELEKGTATAEILRDHRAAIDAVHQRCALLLHVESERTAGSPSSLSEQRLIDVVEAVLIDDEIDAPDRADLVKRILAVATERLVLLARSEETPSRYGFELRSFQEFFVAEALFAGREAHVLERLRHIAFIKAFRNVFLFAASKLEAKPELWHLREVVVGLCAGSHDAQPRPDELAQEALLALDLLESGFPQRSKKTAEQLLKSAAGLIDLPPSWQVLRATWSLADALEPKLTADAGHLASRSMSFWLAVVELADAGVPWAQALGNAHWPQDDSARRAIVDACLSFLERLGPWLAGKVAADMATFPPWFLAPRLGGMVELGFEEGQLPQWTEVAIRWASQRFQLTYGATFFPLVPIVTPELPASSLVLPRSTPATRDAAGSAPMEQQPVVSEPARPTPNDVPPMEPSWLPALLAFFFASFASPERISIALDQLANASSDKALKFAAPSLPWILRMCVRQARTPEKMREMAEALRNDPLMLGSLDDWARAEQAWSRGISFDQLGPTSWPPSAWDGSWFPSDASERENDRTWEWSPDQIGTLIDRHFPRTDWATSKARADLFLSLLLECAFHGVPFPVRIEPEQFEEIVRVSEREALSFYIALPLQVDDANMGVWAEVLDRVGASIPVHRFMGGTPHPLASFLWRAWLDKPSRTGLLRWLAEIVDTGWQPPQAPPLPTEPLSARQSRLDWIALRLASGFTPEEANALAAELAECVGATEDLLFPMFGVPHGMQHRCSIEARQGFALGLLRALLPTLPTWRWRTMALGMLDMTNVRPSGLEDRTTWTKLALPLPLPSRMPSKPPPSTKTAHLEGIHLTNIRVLEDLHLPISRAPESSANGQWIILIGENGVGKSTVLRAVALALMDPGLATGFVAGSGANYLSHEKSVGKVEVAFSSHAIRVDFECDAEGTEIFSASEGARPMLFAYGCRRSSALGGAARALSFKPNDMVATLFDEGADLVHAETWLQKIAFAAKEGSRESLLFSEVQKALLKAMPGIESIDVKSNGVWLYGPAVGKTTLNGLSDGYLTMMGWIVDIIARWAEAQERRKHVVEANFLEEMEGVVLLDELDLHLHPRWQARVIDDLRALFPKLSFIVTTHNPLTLLGARKGEVVVLRRTEDATSGGDSPVIAEQRDLPPGLSVDQVLTGSWFGLASTLDPDTLALLDEHRVLLREGGPESDPRRIGLERELRARLGRFGDTSIERMAQGIAAELTTAMEPVRGLTQEERASLREKIRNAVAAERAKKGRDEKT